MRSLSLPKLTYVILLFCFTCKKKNFEIEGKTLTFYEKENDYDSHIGQLKFENGRIDSVQPEGEGQIITLGTYTISHDGISMAYNVISTYTTQVCMDIDSEAKREACLKTAKEEKYPLWRNNCKIVESANNLFFTRFLLCDNKGILASVEDAVPLSATRQFQGLRIQRDFYKGKIQGSDCLVFNQILPKTVQSDLFPKSAAIGLETMVLGAAHLQSAVNGTSDWTIAFFDIEPIYPAPVWIKTECISRL